MNKISIFIIIVVLLLGCSKGFLEEKPDKKFVVPATLDDCQALLDYNEVMNLSSPRSGEISAGDYYVFAETWAAVSDEVEKQTYIWAKDIYNGTGIQPDWNNAYTKVFYANNVLELLPTLKSSDDPVKSNQLKGAALFFRSQAFFELAQLFCAPYKDGSANDGLGIPLRLSADINIPSKRATIEQTYTQITNDLKAAIGLLPQSGTSKTRPVKAAAHALLSRVYLSMQHYNDALVESEIALSAGYVLMDYNDLNTAPAYPVSPFNSEVIYHSCLTYAYMLGPSRLRPDSSLYRSFSENDLRKKIFFGYNNSNNLVFKGSYAGSFTMFNGMSIDECMLTKAECLARKGDTEAAMKTLNDLLSKRFITGTFVALNAPTSGDALAIILTERRKELLFRGLRWTDLRRLNLDNSKTTTLYRRLADNSFQLKPNSLNYSLPIAPAEIETSGIEQNPRE